MLCWTTCLRFGPQQVAQPMPQLTRWYWGGLARAYAASSALQQTRLGVTRAAWEKLNMEARPGRGRECGRRGGQMMAGKAGRWWKLK